VLDLCWSPDGYNLFVASYDGSLACARFQPEELGKQLSDGELQELMAQLYGNMSNRWAGWQCWQRVQLQLQCCWVEARWTCCCHSVPWLELSSSGGGTRPAKFQHGWRGGVQLLQQL
jgi:hypothetical protein